MDITRENCITKPIIRLQHTLKIIILPLIFLIYNKENCVTESLCHWGLETWNQSYNCLCKAKLQNGSGTITPTVLDILGSWMRPLGAVAQLSTEHHSICNTGSSHFGVAVMHPFSKHLRMLEAEEDDCLFHVPRIPGSGLLAQVLGTRKICLVIQFILALHIWDRLFGLVTRKERWSPPPRNFPRE